MRACVIKRIFIVALFSFSSLCLAREYRSVGIDKKISYASVIAVVTVVSTGNDYYSEPGMRQVYAVAEIEQVLKGSVRGGVIKLITEGLTPEFNPRCCAIGGRYLVFVRNGYLVLESDDLGGDVFVAKGENDFVSSADGPFGVYKIVGGKVLGWSNSNKADLDLVLVEIRQKLADKGGS